MRVNASAGILFPQLEDPICCSKTQEPYEGFPLPTIGPYDNLPTETAKTMNVLGIRLVPLRRAPQ
jgi:hypothetical protein